MKEGEHLNRPIIAITGSAGKSTTKEMIASILERKLKIYKSNLNYNAYWVTKKHKKKINKSHEAIVLEYGMGSKGSIRKHCQAIQPNIGIITNVGTAHIGNFDNKIEGVAKGKSELIAGMKQDGMLFLNADDANSKLLTIQDFKGKIFTVGKMKNADYKATDIRYFKDGMLFSVSLENKQVPFYIPILGEHHVTNALFAIAVSHQLGISLKDIQEGLKLFYKMNRRLTVHKLSKDVMVIDDTYSANPNATRAALDVLDHLNSKNKVVILGSMLELGEFSQEGHSQVGEYLANKNISNLYTIGKEAETIGKVAVENGLPIEKVKHFQTRKELHLLLKNTIKDDTIILLKGSRKMEMDKTVQFLLNTLSNKPIVKKKRSVRRKKRTK